MRGRRHFLCELFATSVKYDIPSGGIREALLFAYSEEWLDDVEVLVLNELNTSKNLDFPYDLYDQFHLNDIDEAECICRFSFLESTHSATRKVATDPAFNEMQWEIGFH